MKILPVNFKKNRASSLRYEKTNQTNPISFQAKDKTNAKEKLKKYKPAILLLIGVEIGTVAGYLAKRNFNFKGIEKTITNTANSLKDTGNQDKTWMAILALTGISGYEAGKLTDEDNNRVLFAHGFVPLTAMMVGSDFFVMPSKFEPCGLTQGESLAVGTPVIASAVRGLVDTLNRNDKFNGILTNPDESLDSENFYLTLKEGLEKFYYKKDKYNSMSHDAIDEDFSWIQKGKTGPVFDYIQALGIDTQNLPEVV